MNLSSLNVDVLLYLLKFVDEVDCFNLALSGILKGFENFDKGINLPIRVRIYRTGKYRTGKYKTELENVNKGINLQNRVTNCKAQLGLRRNGMCELEFRSLKIISPADKSLFTILEWLAAQGYLQNNQKFVVKYDCSHTSLFVKVICSMRNLKTLLLRGNELTLGNLAHVFQSCPQIANLFLTNFKYTMFEMSEQLKNQLRSGFERLRCFAFVSSIDEFLWPVIQETLTWLKECKWLSIVNRNEKEITSLVIDGSLTLDPILAQSLKIAILRYLPPAIVKWILSACLNIRELTLSEDTGKLDVFDSEIARLKKLKEIRVTADNASELKEIVRSCRQAKILWMRVLNLKLKDLAELEPAENMTDITLCWFKGDSMENVFPTLKSWRHLRRLTVLYKGIKGTVPPFEVLADFIMGMKNLSYLTFVINQSNYGQLEIVRDKVNELILPRRSEFKLDINCDILF